MKLPSLIALPRWSGKGLIAALFVCLAHLAHPQQAHADSRITTERSLIMRIESLSRVYAQEHGGRLPTAWSMFNPYLDTADKHYAHFGERLDADYRDIRPSRRYAFLAEPLPLKPPYDGQLFMITRRPFRALSFRRTWYLGTARELEEPGRYILLRNGGGFFYGEYVKESVIQDLFKNHPHLLPTPDTEPERAHERSVRHTHIAQRCFGIILTLGFLYLLARRIFRVKTAPLQQVATEGA